MASSNAPEAAEPIITSSAQTSEPGQLEYFATASRAIGHPKEG